MHTERDKWGIHSTTVSGSTTSGLWLQGIAGAAWIKD